MKTNNHSGFTILELTVAMATFVFLLATVGAIYVSSVRGQRAQLNIQAVQQDIQSFFESLDREVRTAFGQSFQTQGTSGVTLINQSGACVTYLLNSNTIKRYQYSRSGASCSFPGVTSSYTSMTSAKTNIQSAGFAVTQASVSNPGPDEYLSGQQGRVTLNIKGCPTGSSNANDCVTFQTTVTSRQTKTIQ